VLVRHRIRFLTCSSAQACQELMQGVRIMRCTCAAQAVPWEQECITMGRSGSG
jgi:hypothetical protein